jgi:dihydrofolate reductase
MIAAIVAVDANNGIGFNGELLEHIPEDMKRFKELTQYNAIVMGRKTWDSLPKKPLNNRLNIVLSNQLTSTSGCDLINGEYIKTNLLNIILLLQESKDEDYFIIGGGSIYEQLLPYCDTIYMTHIDIPHDNVDTFFPTLRPSEWRLVEESEQREYNGIPYRFLTYKRI